MSAFKVLGQKRTSFIVSKFEYQQRIEWRQFNLLKYLGVSDVRGMSVSSIFVFVV